MENTPSTTLSLLLKAYKESEDQQAEDQSHRFHVASSGGHYLHRLSLRYLFT